MQHFDTRRQKRNPPHFMKRTGNLFNTIISFGNLWLAAHKAWRGKKDKTRIADFYFNLEHELIVLQEELLSGQYQPRPYQIFEVTDPKRRESAAASGCPKRAWSDPGANSTPRSLNFYMEALTRPCFRFRVRVRLAA
ncbi:MAG: hypothetical protein H7839_24180 [Magnetococcus sp. YQC-5]